MPFRYCKDGKSVISEYRVIANTIADEIKLKIFIILNFNSVYIFKRKDLFGSLSVAYFS